jgi:acetolactate synthase-1/2/3 large subunit
VPDPDLLREAAALLHEAERPVIYSGGGTLAAAAWSELEQLAEILEAPVVMSIDGRGAVSDRHDLAHTGLTGQALLEQADVVLAVGTRLWQPMHVWRLRHDAAVIRIDADPDELARHGAPRVGVLSDARLALGGLRDLLHGEGRRASRRAELRAMKDAAADGLNRFQPESGLTRAIRAALPEDAIVVNDLTHMTFFGTVALPVYAPRTFIGPGYMGTLGSALPIALGAQAAFPDRPVVALAGDGGFLYALGELATLRQHDLNVISVVFNNGGYGNVRRTQQEVFGGRLIGCDLFNPDLLALAASFGIAAERVSEASHLEAALRSAVAGRAPALIEVVLDRVSDGVWPMVGRAGGLYPLVAPA